MGSVCSICVRGWCDVDALLAVLLPLQLQVWIVDDGKITFYNGDFDDYRNELIREINAELDEDEE